MSIEQAFSSAVEAEPSSGFQKAIEAADTLEADEEAEVATKGYENGPAHNLALRDALLQVTNQSSFLKYAIDNESK